MRTILNISMITYKHKICLETNTNTKHVSNGRSLQETRCLEFCETFEYGFAFSCPKQETQSPQNWKEDEDQSWDGHHRKVWRPLGWKNAGHCVWWTLVQTKIVISEDSSTKSLYKVEATHHLHSVSMKFLNCQFHKLCQWKLCKVHILLPLWWPATHRSGCPNHTRSRHCCRYHFPQNPPTWTHPPYIHAMSDWWCSLLQELHLPQCTWVKLLG